MMEQLSEIENFDDRVDCLATIDLRKVYRPCSSFTEYFDDVCEQVYPIRAASLVALAVKESSGLVVVEGCVKGNIITIMDELENIEDGPLNSYSNYLLKYAFYCTGFKKASECEEGELLTAYQNSFY